MTTDNFYFGVKRWSVEKSGFSIAFGLSSEKEDLVSAFNSKESGGELQAGEDGPNELRFEAIQQRLFEQMLAFLDIFPLGASGLPMIRDVMVANFVQQHVVPLSTEKKADAGVEIHTIPFQHFSTVSRQGARLNRQLSSLDVIPGTFLLGLTSKYDAFVGELIKLLCIYKPHILSDSEKQFSAVEVLQLSSLEDFKEQLIEKEVESVLRKSHLEQFKWFEKKLEVNLRTDLNSFPSFIEVFERRNLFAHADGKVSSTYLKKCREVGVKQLPELGAVLDIDSDYLYHATQTLLEVGVKLAQVVWRVCEKDEEVKKVQNRALREICFELLCHEHYSTVIELIDFALSKHMKDEDITGEYISRVNRAIALKYNNRQQESTEVLNELLRHPLDRRFRICIFAVMGDIDKLLFEMSLMSKADLELQSFLEWPAFKSVRDDSRFVSALKSVFGDEFIIGNPRVDS